jgi:hypothetical protein
MSECRWSGWPGAWCLDCGREDPHELALADGTMCFVCALGPCCPCSDPVSCGNLVAVFQEEHLVSLECSEPGSNRHNPYVERT